MDDDIVLQVDLEEPIKAVLDDVVNVTLETAKDPEDLDVSVQTNVSVGINHPNV